MSARTQQKDLQFISLQRHIGVENDLLSMTKGKIFGTKKLRCIPMFINISICKIYFIENLAYFLVLILFDNICFAIIKGIEKWKESFVTRCIEII